MPAAQYELGRLYGSIERGHGLGLEAGSGSALRLTVVRVC
jgi:hypothetical protein